MRLGDAYPFSEFLLTQTPLQTHFAKARSEKFSRSGCVP
jgi:hypothetical protein